jgi:DNA segregation ATPase FtsK/SpoIIIE-like protein
MPARTSATQARSTRSASTSAARRRRSTRSWSIPGHIVRQLFGYALLILGVTLFIGLVFRNGRLTDYEWYLLAPLFGTIRWLLPFVLIVSGYELVQSQVKSRDWQITLMGSFLAFLSVDGIAGLLYPVRPGDLGRAGTIGTAMADALGDQVTKPGAGLLFFVLAVAGVLLVVDMSFPAAIAPLGSLVSRATDRLFRPAPPLPADAAAGSRPALNGAASTKAEKAGKVGATATAEAPRFLQDRVAAMPPANAASGPVSSTFAPPALPVARDGSRELAHPVSGFAAGAAAAPGSVVASGVVSSPGAGIHGRDGSIRDGGPARGPRGAEEPVDEQDANVKLPVEDGEQMPLLRSRPEYHLPSITLLEDIAARNGDSSMDHQRHATIIEAKLGSFNIPARVVAWNAGPVVTQYEVEPAPEIKVSRIEALADDLSMALAARTIRIEAPVPGKSVVGIEIPNKDFNIVALRRILEEVDFRAGSKLTFALGRDVAGHARAADLAKMPHLLIAGATGSGKSVMVNALITSLLCNATPDEVRLVLVDLKRVELSAYNGLPHLMVPVITEPERAKAALKWAVAEMETRYRRFAGANARNITSFNETRADPADRMNYLVIIIDELADLMMREGKNVEDPIVRLAQKARATGIHMVLATQRPSVNVVTGLIKANFPSRIAFAMASQIDSRTILDMPGAEDLIGRGDMLFQPADLPRPIRLQGVYVSDKEIGNITEHWRADAEPHYDMGIVDTGDEAAEAEVEPDQEADRLLPDAIGVVQEYDRASASLLQRRLKIGYARAARIIDQLEARGYIGPFDGSNARQVLRRESASPGRSVASGEDDE